MYSFVNKSINLLQQEIIKADPTILHGLDIFVLSAKQILFAKIYYSRKAMVASRTRS